MIWTSVNIWILSLSGLPVLRLLLKFFVTFALHIELSSYVLNANIDNLTLYHAWKRIMWHFSGDGNVMPFSASTYFPRMITGFESRPKHQLEAKVCLIQSLNVCYCFTEGSVMIYHIWASSWENLFLPYANNKGADQPVHPGSLISTFVVRSLDSIVPVVR